MSFYLWLAVAFYAGIMFAFLLYSFLGLVRSHREDGEDITGGPRSAHPGTRIAP